MRGHDSTLIGRAIGLTATLLLAGAPGLLGQVPSHIPSDPEAQIFDLIKRVTALEEKLAALTNGTGSLRVRAPFVVTDAAGNAVLQVVTKEQPLGKDGIVIAQDPGSDIGAIVLYSGAGEEKVMLAQGPGHAGGILLADAKGIQRAEFTGDGRLALSDESGEDYVVLADDVSKDNAAIRIGRDQSGYAVEVGSDKGGSAVLATDDEGFGIVALSDDQDRERAVLDGGGRLELSDAAGRDILSVSEDVIEKDAGVAISLTDGAGQLRVTDKAGKPSAGILGDTRTIVVLNSAGRTAAEMVTGEAGEGLFQAWGEGKMPLALLGGRPGKAGGIVQVSNGQVSVSTMAASDGGAGRFQLNDSNGATVVEAGVLAAGGRGVVRVGPKYRCGSNTGLATVPLGVAANAMSPPDCIIGLP